MKFRRNTAAGAASNDAVLEAGEPGFETDTGVLQIGDGTHKWSELPDTHRMQSKTSADAAYAALVNLARSPELIISGTITRNSNGAATSAPVTWPDGTPGTYTADALSTAFPGAVDAYHVTYGSPTQKTFTQPLITRDVSGAAVNVPAITVA